MIVWLVNPFDAIPGEKWGYKHGMFLANALVSRGFTVIYWTSSFSHALKAQRCSDWEDRVINPSLTVRIIPCRDYSSHVGLRRILSLFDFARGFFFRGWSSDRPHCLVVPSPNLFGDIVALWLARRHKASIVIDFRDLWPEIFVRALPSWAKRFSRQIFSPLYFMRTYVFRNASGLAAVCETYRQIAFRDSPELMKRPNELVYSTGVDLVSFRFQMAVSERDADLVAKEQGSYWAIYAGTIGDNYDINTLLQASVLLQASAPQLKIVVAGDGPLRSVVLDFISANKVTNLVYVGVLDMPTLCRYYAQSDIGLSIYAPDSTVAIPAKAFDYFAAELPIVNSVEGEFERFIRDNAIGFQYRSGCPKSLADSLAAAVSDPSRLLSMKGRLGKLAPEYDRDAQYTKFVDLIERVSKTSVENY